MQYYPKVLIAILARDKEATLPLYLKCIENLNYPKNRIFVYIRTNDNSDQTELLLINFVLKNKDLYSGIEFDNKSIKADMDRYHHWNSNRFKILGAIRNVSIQKTMDHNCDFYFVADCDNFIFPFTLKRLVSYNLPIVSPLLSNDQNTLYANFHYDVDENGYLKDNPQYTNIFSRMMKGIIDVPVVHCTYLVRADVIPKLTYDDDSFRYEYVIFSDSARKNGIPQYIDNTEKYGILTFKTKPEEMIGFEQKYF